MNRKEGSVVGESSGREFGRNDIFHSRLKIKKKLHEYFDSLGDISDITYSSSEFKFQIDPQSLHSDFSDIKNFLLDFQPAMKNIISSKFPATTLAYYTSFLSIHVCSSFLFLSPPFLFSFPFSFSF